MTDIKKPFHELVAEQIIELLKQGAAPWQRPWQSSESGMCLPINPTTGKRYKGINAIYLMSQQYADQRWMTYKQAQALEAQVRRGEKGTLIQYWKFSEEQNRTDADGMPVINDQGEALKQTVKLERPRVFFATVFNAEQIEGLPPVQPRTEPAWNAVERAELIIQTSGAKIINNEQDGAYYRVDTDKIYMPQRGQFQSAKAYYATALHELGHWTGHGSRLDRDLANPYGSEAYAREELRAEIASMILGEELGIGHDPTNHAAYVHSWIQVLQNDPLEIFRAAADAEKIQAYVMGFEQTQLQELNTGSLQNHTDNTLSLEKQEPEIPVLLSRIHQTIPIDEVDARVADARLNFMNQPDEKNKQAFDELARSTFGFALPHEWSGRIQIQGNVHKIGNDENSDQNIVSAFEPKQEPEFWGVYAQDKEGLPEWLADCVSHSEADQLANRLRLIDAYSDQNEYARRMKLACINEERVNSDSNSTQEEIQIARDMRKEAEFVFTFKDMDLQHRIAHFEQGLKDSVTDKNEVHQTHEASASKLKRTHIQVPFKDKEVVKSLGAKWDRTMRLWYVPDHIDLTAFSKWMGHSHNAGSEPVKQEPERIYLAVAYDESVAAKSAGALWDKAKKSWYVGPDADVSQLARWSVGRSSVQQASAMEPEVEFAEALASLGCVVDGAHPIMDGQKHRIAVLGDKKGARAGFYVGFMDGHPAGYIKNNKTGVELKWKAKGYVIDPAHKAQLQAEVSMKQSAREAQQKIEHEFTAQRMARQMAELIPVQLPTPYMQAKGINPQAGVFTDIDGLTTYVPVIDVNGKQWSMQYVNEDGVKRYAKNSRKEGCFNVVGEMSALLTAPVLMISEGYATAASLSQVLGFATVAAFDSGNLPSVVKALHEKFPDKPVIVAGDDDQFLQMTQNSNPGRSKAKEAAHEVGGITIFPIFAPGEQTNQSKEFTDFNDLMNKSVLGSEGVARQVGAVVSSLIEKQRSNTVVKNLKQNLLQEYPSHHLKLRA